MSPALFSLKLTSEADLVVARQRTRTLAELLGFDRQDQTRLATAVSEIVRNALQYAGGGRVSFTVEGKTPPQLLTVVVSDHGPGIPHLDRVLSGHYQSTTGMGLGIVGARRLVDQLTVEPLVPRGIEVTLRKIFPRSARFLEPKEIPALAASVVQRQPESPVEELRRQNQDLLRTLAALRERQEELERLNGELEDTNRGVIALLAELDEKADHLRRADEMKTRFLSNMSHEFRTPLTAIRGLSNLLLDRVDGELNAEQDRQVRLVARAAQELSELVDDLLDLAKVEAGKVEVHPVVFDVRNLLAALRGMLRPLWLNTSVSLVFEEPEGLPPLFTDEGKVSQVLRNFISNALKFTENGEVRVSISLTPDGEHVRFSVSDTGIGIRPEDQERIFQEFAQVNNAIQRRTKGTGLGLPLSRRLAELLGGTVSVTSEFGVGSTFSLEIPVRVSGLAPEPLPVIVESPDEALPVLVVEDSTESLLLYERYLQGSLFHVVHASTLERARYLLAHRSVKAVILDILLRGADTWGFLADLKASPETRDIPVIVVTQLDDPRKAYALRADAFATKPPTRRWLLETLQRATRGEPRTALVIDQEEAPRYLVARMISEMGWRTQEAGDTAAGVVLLNQGKPDLVVLSLELGDAAAREVVAALRDHEATRAVPLILTTGKESIDGAALFPEALGVVRKNATQRDLRTRLEELLVQVPAPSPSSASQREAR